MKHIKHIKHKWNRIKNTLLLLMVIAAIHQLAACDLYDVKMYDLETSVEDNNEDGLNYMDTYEYENALDCFLKAEEGAEDYKSKCDNIFEKDISESLLCDTYNNLCYYYYTVDDYNLSLEYGEKAAGFNPEDYYIYSNLGNTLSALGRNDEAMQYYDKAIEIDEDADYAYYGKGCIYYDNSEYEKALEMFNAYDKLIPEDIDAQKYIIYCDYNLSNYEKALELTEKALVLNTSGFDYSPKKALKLTEEDLEIDDNDYELYQIKGDIINASEGYDKAVLFYKDLEEQFPNDIKVRTLIGEFYYNNEQYQTALEVFKKCITIQKDNPDADIDSWIINCYVALEEVDQALIYLEEAIAAGRESSLLYNSVGDMYSNLKMNVEAARYYDEAIRLAPEDGYAYFNKVYALYNGKRYKRCIEAGMQALDQATAYDNMPWYIAECYFNINEYEKAITYYEKALKLDPENDTILSYIGYSYLMEGNYEKAGLYAEQALAINPDNETAPGIKEELQNKKKPINEQLKKFIKENYLYYNDIPDIDEKLDRLFKNENMTTQDIIMAVNEMKQKEDIFTFVLTEEEYDYYSDENVKDVINYNDGDIVYVRIEGFNTNTDNKVIEVLDSVEKPEQKKLVIDLRGNGGGITDCANNILDVLLPDCVTSTLIDREGYTYNYYSDASQITFNKIYVLVDGNTASASELLTLGLKTYLNNVTIIGSNTFGKGVGQYVFEDKERKLMLYLVNHYWNVRQQNIMSTSITPDDDFKSDNLKDYFNYIKKN